MDCKVHRKTVLFPQGYILLGLVDGSLGFSEVFDSLQGTLVCGYNTDD